MTKKIQKIDVETGKEWIGDIKAEELEAGIKDANYIHYQISPSIQWLCQHNLNKFPAVTVVDSANNIIYCEVKYLDLNSVELDMTYQCSGKAYFN